MESLQLEARCLGGEPQDPPLVILHGMLGSSRNWATAGADLARGFQVWALDLRNHGNSPHHPEHSYTAMAADLEAFRVQKGWPKMALLGHSMGGKTAMRYAVDHPEVVTRLAILDIGPGDHDPYHAREIEALVNLPLERIENRKVAEELLSERVQDWAMRQFLLTNLRRREGVWGWQVNLPALQKNLISLAKSPLLGGERFIGPTQLIRGANSTFVSNDEVALAKEFFPALEEVTISRAGHNVHVENKVDFVKEVLRFLTGQS